MNSEEESLLFQHTLLYESKQLMNNEEEVSLPDITGLLCEVLSRKLNISDSLKELLLSIHTIFDTTDIMANLIDLDYEIQGFIYKLLEKNWTYLDIKAQYMELLLKHSHSTCFIKGDSFVKNMFGIIIIELKKEELIYDFDTYLIYFNDIYKFTGVARWFEVFALLCTRFSRLPIDATPLQISDSILDAAISEENHLLIEDLIELLIESYGEEQALASISTNSISSILLSEQTIPYSYLVFAKKKLMFSVDEHAIFMEDFIKHSNAIKCVSIFKEYSTKTQRLIAEILCNTLMTAYLRVMKGNLDVIKEILIFSADVNIEATTEIMLELVKNKVWDVDDEFNESFINDIFNQCYDQSNDEWHFENDTRYTELCELLDIYFPK